MAGMAWVGPDLVHEIQARLITPKSLPRSVEGVGI
jgi:hypothetical protein